MKINTKILLTLVIFLFSSLINLAFADDDIIKFKLEIKPNQQKVEAKIDGDEHKQIQIRAEYVKLNTVTNNYHIKVTITNNSGQILYHQLALIDKVEHADVTYPDGTTDYIKYDDGKQIIKTLPYYNYGNIKPNQTTPREWYLSNTGKDEIEIKGYIISKEIPIALDPKIAAANPGMAQTLTTYITALRNNDMDMALSVVPTTGATKMQNKINAMFTYERLSRVLQASYILEKPTDIDIAGKMCLIEYNYIDPNDGRTYPWTLVFIYDSNKWWIVR